MNLQKWIFPPLFSPNKRGVVQVPANVYVKKTPSGQQSIDISCLEAPAGKPTNGETDSSDSSQSSTCPKTEEKINGSLKQEGIVLETAAS